MGEAVFNLQERYITTTCFDCGVAIAMPYSFMAQRRRDLRNFFCLNGHMQCYIESEADKVRKELSAKQLELDRQKREADWQRQLREKADKDRKKVERKLKRVEKGVCPHCNRSFENIRRHMESKHSESATHNPD